MHEIGTADDHYDLLDKLRRFLAGYATWTDPTFSGTGNGTMTDIDTYPDTPTETWTITCTSAATDGGTFSVTGSVSGAQAAATVGTPYDNGIIAFTLNDGSTDFAVSDEFSLDVTEGLMTTAGEEWTVLRWDTSGADHELIVQGPGTSGTEEIFCGVKTYQDRGSDYYNWAVAGFTGYVSGNSFETQPGNSGSKGVPMWNQTTPYWLRADGNAWELGAAIDTVYEACGAGRFLPYGTPGQYPYPLFVAGMLTSASATRYSDTSHTMPWRGGSARVQVRFVDGNWKTVSTWPWGNADIAATPIRDTGGDYPLLPIYLYDTENIYGEIDGIKFVSGFNQAAENIIQGDDGYDHVVLPDTYRTGFPDYWALRLD